MSAPSLTWEQMIARAAPSRPSSEDGPRRASWVTPMQSDPPYARSGDTRPRRPPLALLGVLAVVTAAITLANAWIFVHRKEGWLFRYVAETTIRSPAEELRVTGFDRDGERLVVHTEPAREGRWAISSPRGTRGSVPGPHPAVRLTPGLHELRLEQRTGDGARRAIELTVLFEPAADEVSVLSMSVPFGTAPRYSLAELAAAPSHYAAEDVEEGRRILAPLALDELEPEARIERLLGYVHGELDGHRGTPSEAMLRSLEPLAQLQRATRGEDAVHCAGFAEVYTFLAAVSGIPTRVVTVSGEDGGVLLGAHSFAESYVEGRGWAYVDPTLGLGLVRGPDGSYLDAIELSRAHEAGLLGGLTASLVREDRVERVPYAAHARFSRVHLTRDGTYLFSRPERGRRTSWARVLRWALGTDLGWAAEPARERHYLKQGALAAQALVGLLWLAVLARAARRALRPARSGRES